NTTALVFVSPSNPTDEIYTPEETKAISQWALQHGLWLITDEIYEHLIYDDDDCTSILKAVSTISHHTVTVNEVANTYAMTGWRVGWMIAPADVIQAAKTLQSHATSNVNNIAQKAALAAVTGPLDAVDEMLEAFDDRRKTMVKILNDIEGFHCPMPKGAF